MTLDEQIEQKRSELAQLESFCDNARLEADRICDAAQRLADGWMADAKASAEAAAKDREAAKKEFQKTHAFAVEYQKFGRAAAVVAEKAASASLTLLLAEISRVEKVRKHAAGSH